MTQIKDALIDFNPWWKGAFTLEYHERELYGQVQKFMPLPQMIAFTGLRRSGKTTLMQKMVVDAIDDGREVQISKCPNGHGKIKSPMCCGQDMTCSI